MDTVDEQAEPFLGIEMHVRLFRCNSRNNIKQGMIRHRSFRWGAAS
jgi:hypothetical protein